MASMTNDTATHAVNDMRLVSDSTRQLFVTVAGCVVNAGIAFFGIICNLMNAVVFARMGFQETTNISLLGLAISDLCCLLTAEWIYLCFNPIFNAADLQFVPFEIEYITGGWPHLCFARVTGFIMAFVTLERCLCIARPLEVKRILTRARTLHVFLAIYAAMIASICPAFEVNLLQWKFYADKNRTLIGIAYTEGRSEVERVLLATNNSFGYIAFGMVTIFTAILITRLKSSRKWLAESADGSHAHVVRSKDRRVMKLVLSIAAAFVVFFFPVTVVFAAEMAYPQFGTGGKYANLFYVCATCAYFLEIVHSSVNFFIYYNMSAKFRQTTIDLLSNLFTKRVKNV